MSAQDSHYEVLRDSVTSVELDQAARTLFAQMPLGTSSWASLDEAVRARYREVARSVLTAGGPQ